MDRKVTGLDSAVSRSVSRRTLVKAAAWSAPVVALSVAAPSASASPDTVGSWTVTIGSTTGGYSTIANSTTYQWIGAGTPVVQPKVQFTDTAFVANWSTGLMTVTYTYAKSATSTLTNIASYTPYKIGTATEVATANSVGASASVMAVNDTVTAFDSRVWTCTSLSQTGTGTARKLVVTFTSNTDYTVTDGNTNTIYFPRMGVKIVYTVTSASGRPFRVDGVFAPEQTDPRLIGANGTAGGTF